MMRGKSDMESIAWHLNIAIILLETHEILVVGGSNQKAVGGVYHLISKHNTTQSNWQLKKEYLKKACQLFFGGLLQNIYVFPFSIWSTKRKSILKTFESFKRKWKLNKAKVMFSRNVLRKI